MGCRPANQGLVPDFLMYVDVEALEQPLPFELKAARFGTFFIHQCGDSLRMR